MASRAIVGFCFMLLLLAVMEVAAISKRCDASVEITIGLDASSALSDEEYDYQRELVLALIDNLLPGPNNVIVGAMFYSSGISDKFYDSGKIFASFEQKEALNAAVRKTYDREEGEDALYVPWYMAGAVLYGSGRSTLPTRHIGLFIADAVVENYWVSYNPEGYNQRIIDSNIEIIALEVGNNKTLKILDNYLEDVVKEHRIIKVQNFSELIDDELLDYLTHEICQGTIKKLAYEELVSNEVIASYVYNEHTYYLSRGFARNLKQVTDDCLKLGGYLARMNDKLEYAAMQRHLLNLTESQNDVLVDGTNAKHNGNCTFYSGEPMSFQEPQMLYKMFDDWCQFPKLTLCNAWVPRYNLFRRIECVFSSYNQMVLRFLCEVPGKGEELWRLTMVSEYSTPDVNFTAFEPSKPYEGYWVDRY